MEAPCKTWRAWSTDSSFCQVAKIHQQSACASLEQQVSCLTVAQSVSSFSDQDLWKLLKAIILLSGGVISYQPTTWHYNSKTLWSASHSQEKYFTNQDCLCTGNLAVWELSGLRETNVSIYCCRVLLNIKLPGDGGIIKTLRPQSHVAV